MGKKLLAGAAATAGLSIALLGGVTTVANAAPAQAPLSAAATCSGTGCDGKDPYDSGCGGGRSEIDRQSTSKGTFILYYSNTCKTNWVETPSFAGGTSYLELTVQDRNRDKLIRFHTSPTPGRHYGNMVYSPGDNCAVAYVDWDGGLWDVILTSSFC
ncbi:DUF2690 domain-containing protein [Lentzea sp. NPDC004789]